MEAEVLYTGYQGYAGGRGGEGVVYVGEGEVRAFVGGVVFQVSWCRRKGTMDLRENMLLMGVVFNYCVRYGSSISA